MAQAAPATHHTVATLQQGIQAHTPDTKRQHPKHIRGWTLQQGTQTHTHTHTRARAHTHTHTVQTDRSEGQCGLTEIF